MPLPTTRRPARPTPSVTINAARTATRATASTTDGSSPNQVPAGSSGPAPDPVPPVPPSPSTLGPGDEEPWAEALSEGITEVAGEAVTEMLGSALAPLGAALWGKLGCGAPLGPGTTAVVKWVQRYSRRVRPEAWIAAASSRPTKRKCQDS